MTKPKRDEPEIIDLELHRFKAEVERLANLSAVDRSFYLEESAERLKVSVTKLRTAVHEVLKERAQRVTAERLQRERERAQQQREKKDQERDQERAKQKQVRETASIAKVRERLQERAKRDREREAKRKEIEAKRAEVEAKRKEKEKLVFRR
jgi:hypothetical protein